LSPPALPRSSPARRPPNLAALARTLGIDPVPDRARFIAEVTRLAYDLEGRNPSAAAFLQAVRLKVHAAAEKGRTARPPSSNGDRSEEHTAELQSRVDCVFR